MTICRPLNSNSETDIGSSNCEDFHAWRVPSSFSLAYALRKMHLLVSLKSGFRLALDRSIDVRQTTRGDLNCQPIPTQTRGTQ